MIGGNDDITVIQHSNPSEVIKKIAQFLIELANLGVVQIDQVLPVVTVHGKPPLTKSQKLPGAAVYFAPVLTYKSIRIFRH